MKQLATSIFIAAVISFAPALHAATEGAAAQKALAATDQVTILYSKGLLDMHCTATPLGKVLQSIGKKTSTNFILSDPAIEKTPVTISLHQVTFDNALKRILRGYSYSSSYENDIETVTVFPSRTGKNATGAPAVARTLESSKPQAPIRPDTYIAPDTTIEEDEVITPDDTEGQDVATDNETVDTPGDKETSPENTAEEKALESDPEREGEEELFSLDDFMPIDLPEAAPVPDNMADETGVNSMEQYRQRATAEKEFRLKRSLAVLASEHTNLYNDALNEVVGIDSPEATTALLQTATSEEEEVDSTTKLVAAEGLWHHAADLGFDDPISVEALQQIARDNDPAVRNIGQQALRDMERYRARQQ